jgi:DNA-binding NarL/FixJ family response regulator
MELIARTHDLACCGDVRTASEAQKAVAEIKPDLVVLDMILQARDSLDLIKVFNAEAPAVKVLVLSQHDEMTYAERVLRAGAKGYVMKENATTEILSAIRTVLAGGIYVSQKISDLALRRMTGNNGLPETFGSFIDILTDREMQVFGLLGQGNSSRAIAESLGLSLKTIESHRENIKRKLELADAAALVHRATLWARNNIQVS